MARRLIKEEGLLCDGSSGTALLPSFKSAKNLSEDQKCLVILPDGIKNYMTKFPNDKWMKSRGLRHPEKYQKDLIFNLPLIGIYFQLYFFCLNLFLILFGTGIVT